MTDRSTLRRRTGMSLRQLAQASGISVSRLSLFERGECRLSFGELADISAILKERLDETPVFLDDKQVLQFLDEVGA